MPLPLPRHGANRIQNRLAHKNADRSCTCTASGRRSTCKASACLQDRRHNGPGRVLTVPWHKAYFHVGRSSPAAGSASHYTFDLRCNVSGRSTHGARYPRRRHGWQQQPQCGTGSLGDGASLYGRRPAEPAIPTAGDVERTGRKIGTCQRLRPARTCRSTATNLR